MHIQFTIIYGNNLGDKDEWAILTSYGNDWLFNTGDAWNIVKLMATKIHNSTFVDDSSTKHFKNITQSRIQIQNVPSNKKLLCSVSFQSVLSQNSQEWFDLYSGVYKTDSQGKNGVPVCESQHVYSDHIITNTFANSNPYVKLGNGDILYMYARSNSANRNVYMYRDAASNFMKTYMKLQVLGIT